MQTFFVNIPGVGTWQEPVDTLSSLPTSNNNDGEPSVNLQKPGTILGRLTYWKDGEPYVYVYPSELTGTFMPFFWGI